MTTFAQVKTKVRSMMVAVRQLNLDANKQLQINRGVTNVLPPNFSRSFSDLRTLYQEAADAQADFDGVTADDGEALEFAQMDLIVEDAKRIVGLGQGAYDPQTHMPELEGDTRNILQHASGVSNLGSAPI